MSLTGGGSRVAGGEAQSARCPGARSPPCGGYPAQSLCTRQGFTSLDRADLTPLVPAIPRHRTSVWATPHKVPRSIETKRGRRFRTASRLAGTRPRRRFCRSCGARHDRASCPVAVSRDRCSPHFTMISGDRTCRNSLKSLTTGADRNAHVSRGTCRGQPTERQTQSRTDLGSGKA